MLQGLEWSLQPYSYHSITFCSSINAVNCIVMCCREQERTVEEKCMGSQEVMVMAHDVDPSHQVCHSSLSPIKRIADSL